MKTVRMVSTGSYLPGEPIDERRARAPRRARCPRTSSRASRSSGATGWSTRRPASTTRATPRWRRRPAEQALGRGRRSPPSEVELLVSRRPARSTCCRRMVTFVQERSGSPACATVGDPLGLRRLRRGARHRPPVPRARRPTTRPSWSAARRSRRCSCRSSWARSPTQIRMRDRMNPYNFGDGAGAVVLRAFDEGGEGIHRLGDRLRRRRAQARHADHRRRHARAATRSSWRRSGSST